MNYNNNMYSCISGFPEDNDNKVHNLTMYTIQCKENMDSSVDRSDTIILLLCKQIDRGII